MQSGPYIKLAIDLHRMDRYFPLQYDAQGGFEYNLTIARERYDEVADLLREYGIFEDQVLQEVCFARLWVEKETQGGQGTDQPNAKFTQMYTELDKLNDFLMNNRVTSIHFLGEYEKDLPGEEFSMMEEINIDRVCDGLRSVFREEFHQDKQRRRSKGLTAWQRRKLIRIRNYFMIYFSSIPILDELSLEDQNQLVEKLIAFNES